MASATAYSMASEKNTRERAVMSVRVRLLDYRPVNYGVCKHFGELHCSKHCTGLSRF